MKWSDSNMAGDGWTWFITLTIRKDGTYSVGATQTSTDGPTYKLPSIYPLRSGRHVRDALEEIFQEDPLSVEEINWEAIQDVLAQHVPKLAEEVAQAFDDDRIAEEEAERQAEEQAKKEKPIYEWIEKSSWPRSNLSNVMGRGMENARRQKYVFSYTQNYYETHGKFPTGTHTLTDSFVIQFPDA